MAMPVDQKLLRTTKFPAEFSQKVDMQKVNVEVMKKWIARTLSEILGNEDDVVIELCFNLLEGSRYPNVKELQIQLTGFLDKDTPRFCKDLWNLCLSAQTNPQGVPKELLEAKKLELIQEKADAAKAAKIAQERKEAVTARDQDIDTTRRRERGERGERFDRGRGWGRGRGGRDHGEFDSRRPPRSRSPPSRRERSPYKAPPRREIDTYVPKGSSRAAGKGDRRDRSLTRTASRSSQSRSRSRSLPRRSRTEGIVHSRSRSPPRKQRRLDRNGSVEAVENGGRLSGNRRRARSPSSDRESRSPSPRPRRRRYSSSRSPSPRRDRRRRHRRSSPASSDDSRHRGRGGRHVKGNRRAPSPSPDNYRSGRRADIVRPKTRKEDPRLSRSPADAPRQRRRRPSESRSRSRSRSWSRSGRRGERKRRRSLPRYEPRKRKNTSSPSPSPSPEPEPDLKRHKRGASRSSLSDVGEVNRNGSAQKTVDRGSSPDE